MEVGSCVAAQRVEGWGPGWGLCGHCCACLGCLCYLECPHSRLLFTCSSRYRCHPFPSPLAGGGQVCIFSAMHASGEQLNQLTGIAAILRFPLPDLEDQEFDAEV